MDFLKKFLFVIVFIILWDIVSHLIDKGFSIHFNEFNILNYIFKIIIIFILFLIINKLIQYVKYR